AAGELTVSGAAAGAIVLDGTPTPIAFIQDPASGALVAMRLVKLPRNANGRDDNGDGQIDDAAETGTESDADFYARLAALGVKTFRYTPTTATAPGTWGTGTLNITFCTYSTSTIGCNGWQDARGNAGRAD